MNVKLLRNSNKQTDEAIIKQFGKPDFKRIKITPNGEFVIPLDGNKAIYMVGIVKEE